MVWTAGVSSMSGTSDIPRRFLCGPKNSNTASLVNGRSWVVDVLAVVVTEPNQAGPPFP